MKVIFLSCLGFQQGHHCVFMLKPAWSGQGEGIILSDDHIRISELLKDANRKFVIQKYVCSSLLPHSPHFSMWGEYKSEFLKSCKISQLNNLTKCKPFAAWNSFRYIERPLLVYKTKFDLRQYFLITIDRYCLRGWVAIGWSYVSKNF